MALLKETVKEFEAKGGEDRIVADLKGSIACMEGSDELIDQTFSETVKKSKAFKERGVVEPHYFRVVVAYIVSLSRRTEYSQFDELLRKILLPNVGLYGRESNFGRTLLALEG